MKPLTAAAVACIAVAGAVSASGPLGVRVNTSPSVPVGLYRTAAKAPAVGDTVFLCPPDTPPFQLARERGYIGQGPCAGGYQHLFKRILAAKTDTVSVSADGVSINGRVLPASAPLDADPAARPMPVYRFGPAELPADELFLMTDTNPRSFDARYFGPVKVSQIEAVVTPLFVW